MKKVELLAPAGNYEALKGAIMAGADAIYLGGNAFGARAYADNFSEEEICKGIRFAHLFGKKIYLTVNTLVKEKEFEKLYTFLFPFYKAGLDGVIIQDLGVLQFVKKHFPGLSLHVSTQMTITGAYGAELLKEEGAERIVPARELSLEEIKEMKEKTGLEIETFIHGAMCYCYSGQCLLSSILGGRSGNRGRCAQPCRLPYRVNGSKEQYPLSMKDMCTLAILPELIEAGIDSFKIEGRMKKPEYAAGVTAMYRKYIDLYYNNPDAFCIEEADWNYLKALYIRSDIGEGYYHQHNGKNMITIASPAYLGSDDNLLREIRAAYIEKNLVLLATASAVFKKDMPAVLTLSCGGISVKVEGEVVQKALKQPLSEEKIREQLLKIGNTDFSFESLEITGDADIFMPVSSLNQLRRAAIEALEEKLIEENGLSYSLRRDVLQKMDMVFEQHKDEKVVKEDRDELHVLVGTKEQLDAALSQKVDRIYLDRQLLTMQVLEELRFLRDKNEIGENIRFYLAFPQIIRYKDEKQLDRLFQLLCEDIIDGVLIRNLESIVYLQKKKNQKPVVTDTNLYIFNKEAVSFMQKYGKEYYLPMELNRHELKELIAKTKGMTPLLSCVVYGRQVMMLSANCLKKTTDSCKKTAGFVTLTDRYRKEFPVYTDCIYCYNIMYNSVPLSLHGMLGEKDRKKGTFRLDFTLEDKKETGCVISFFADLLAGKVGKLPYQEFTTGHYKRGIE